MIESRDNYITNAKLDDKAFKEALRENFIKIVGKNFPI